MKNPLSKIILFLLIVLASCTLGHKEVRLTELTAPPRLILDGDDLLVKLDRSKEFPTFTIYEVLPTIDEGDKFILLKVHQARGRNFAPEFRVHIVNKQDSMKAYKIFWVDPDNTRNPLQIEKQ